LLGIYIFFTLIAGRIVRSSTRGTRHDTPYVVSRNTKQY